MQNAHFATESLKQRLREHGLWFVDIPRTSSSSVKIELARQLGEPFGKRNLLDARHAMPQYVPDHLSARDMRAALGADLWEDLFTFSLVRNPWDRAASMYRYRLIKNNIPPEWRLRDYLAHWQRAEQDDPHFSYHGHRWSQLDFLTDDSGNLLVDRVVKYEERDSELKTISERIEGLRLGALRIQHSTPEREKRNYRSYYDAQSAAIVRSLFVREIERFGYEF